MASVNNAIQLLLSSSRCTLPRGEGNGSLGGYGPRGRVRVSTRSWSLVPVPVVPSLGRRATGACLGMARVNGECQRRDPVALSSSRCTLPREKGNGSLGGYGPRGRVRVSTRSWSLVPVPVVPSLGRRTTGASLGMGGVNGECQ